MMKDQLLTEFCNYLFSEKGLAINSVEAYRTDILRFFQWLEQGVENDDLNHLDSTHVLSHLFSLQNKSYSESTICRALISLKLFFRYAYKEKHLKINCTLHLESPKLWQLIPEVLTQHEVEQLLDAPKQDDFYGARDKAVFETLYATGIRVSEICALGLYHIDDDFIRVMGKGSKERIVPIGKKAVDAIDYYITHFRGEIKDENEPLFITSKRKRITRIEIWERIKHYGNLVGIQKNISPHTLRHSFATHLLNNGAELRIIQEMLGHATIASTDRYTQLNIKDLKSSFECFHPRK